MNTLVVNVDIVHGRVYKAQIIEAKSNNNPIYRPLAPTDIA
ncbi:MULTISPECIES: hypothetical protein [unclassified Pseudoalteromonas]|nr:hypothetical protein [Pseudoalteromonas sp. A601]